MLITCDGCDTKMRVPDDAAGKRVKCPKCGAIVSVPKPEPEAAPPADEAPIEITPMDPADTPKSSGRAKPPPLASKSRDQSDDDDEEDDGHEERKPRRKKRRDDEDEDDNERDDKLDVRQPPESIGFSLTSMILGIASLLVVIFFGYGATCLGGVLFCCCPLAPMAGALVGGGTSMVPAILALIFGYLGLPQGGKGYAIAGMITGGVTVVLALVLIALMLIFGATLFGAIAVAPPPPPQFPKR